MKFPKFQNMNYRRRIFILTFSVCLIVTSVILWSIYGSVKKQLQEKEIQSNLLYLEQTGTSIDYMIGMINNTTYSVFQSSDVKQLMYREASENVYDYIQVMNRVINSFINANPSVHSVYIYNPRVSQYLSTNQRGIFHVDSDFQARMEKQEIHVHDFPILRWVDGQLICTQMIADNYDVIYRHNDSCVFVNYNFNWMLDNMNIYIQPERGDSLFLIDGEGHCFTAYGPDVLDSKAIEAEMQRCQALLNGQSAVSIPWQGQNSLITTYRVPSTGWQLFKVVSLAELEQEIQSLRNTIWIVNIISALAILFLYYGVSRWLYRPLNRIVSMLPDRGQTKSQDEFSLVESYYLQQLNEIKELRRISEANAILLEEPIINRLLYHSESLPEHEFSELYRIYRFHISFERPYLICVCAFDQMEQLSTKFDLSKDKMLMLLLIKDVIKESLSAGYLYDYSYSNDECMTILLQIDPQRPHSALVQALRRLQKSFKAEFGSTVSIAMSGPLSDYHQVSVGYRQALDLLQYRMVEGRTSILSAELPQRKQKKLAEYDGRLENKRHDAVAQAQYFQAAQGTEDFVRELSCLDCQSIQIVLSVFFGKIKQRAYTSNESRRTPLNMEKINALLDEKRVRFLEDLPLLLGLLFEYLESNRDADRANQPDPVVQAQAIVEEEYHNMELSATYLANRVGISSVQLGRLFRKQCGKTIPEYINELRLEKATEWIKSSSLTISEIALRVGYQNESYFFRVFKEKYGITPRQYEKQYRDINHHGGRQDGTH